MMLSAGRRSFGHSLSPLVRSEHGNH
jgi:hypothetical protein